jgi:hypothetical protein
MLNENIEIQQVDFNPWFRINKTEDSSTIFSHFLDYQFNYSGTYTKYTDLTLLLKDFTMCFI